VRFFGELKQAIARLTAFRCATETSATQCIALLPTAPWPFKAHATAEWGGTSSTETAGNWAALAEGG